MEATIIAPMHRMTWDSGTFSRNVSNKYILREVLHQLPRKQYDAIVLHADCDIPAIRHHNRLRA